MYYMHVADSTGGSPVVNEFDYSTANEVNWAKQTLSLGNYFFYNKGATANEIGKDSIGYYWYDGSDEWVAGADSPASSFTTHFLGSHNYYYWPKQQKFLARLADGSSFKFYDVATGANSLTDQIDFKLLRSPGFVTVPIVFDGDVAFIYSSGASTTPSTPQGYLRAHVLNNVQKSLWFEAQVDVGNYEVVDEYGTDINGDPEFYNQYQYYSLVKCAPGEILFRPGISGADAVHMTYTFDSSDDSYTFVKTTAVSIPATTSTALATDNIVFRQSKESVDTYSAGTVPPIWGVVDGAFMPVTCDNTGVTLGTDVVPTETWFSYLPEHFDVGHSYFMTLAPVDCANDGTMAITNASARFYSYADTSPVWSCVDLLESDGTTPLTAASTNVAWTV